MTVEELRAAALKLPLKERAELAEALLASLDDLSEQEHHLLWVDEANRRLAELEAGTATERPVREVLDELRGSVRAKSL